MSNFDIKRSSLDDPMDLREDFFVEVEVEADLDIACTEGTDGSDSQVKTTGGISLNLSIVVDFDLIIAAKGENDTKL